MGQTFVFPGSLPLPSRGFRKKRPLGDKLQELAMRSVADLEAIEMIVDDVLARLLREDRALAHKREYGDDEDGPRLR